MDILAITETWLTGTVSDGPVISALLPNGYSVVHSPRGSRGGGLAIVYRQSLNVTRVNVAPFASFEALECMVRGLITLRICVVYQPHRTSSFIDEFSNYASYLTSAPGNLIVVGDFNLHVDDLTDKSSQDFLSSLAVLGLKQHITVPTHKNSHTLDLLITTLDGQLDPVWRVEDHGFPDHYAVFTQIAVKKPALPRKSIQYRKTKCVTREALLLALASTRLQDADFAPASTLDELVSTYVGELQNVLNAVAPLKTCEITLRPNSYWFNDEIRSAKQHRRQMERLWRHTRLSVHKEMFLAEKNKVNALIRRAKEQHYQEKVAACSGNQQQLFKIVSSLLGRSREQPLPSGDPASLAQKFSDFFILKIESIQRNIPVTQIHLDAEQPVVSEPLSDLTPISLEELTRTIGSSPNKNCDLDPLATNLLKLVLPELGPYILRVINTSLSTGIFPAAFKTALVSPRLKKPSLNPDELSNYRPVSNLSFLSKTLERVVAKQLCAHLDMNNLHEPHQSAYRCNHSTETALLRIHTDIKQALADRKVVLMALLDLSAAFDTISHDMLLHSLAAVGVQGMALQWFTSYVKDRTQTTLVAGSRSTPQPLSTGVAQGSVLGPVLFSVYTRSLGALLRSHGVEYHLYADDTQIYVRCPIDDIDAGIALLEKCIHDVQQWMNSHKLMLNAGKTEFIVYASKERAKHLPPRTLRVGESNIPQSLCVKNVGVFMDQTLSLERQVNQICRAAYAQLKGLSKVKHFIDRKSLETILHALVTTRIDYCNSLLSGANDCVLRKLQTLQNACARLLSNTSYFQHITPVLIELHWLPVKQRIRFKILVMTFKCINGQLPQYLNELLCFYQPPRDVRSSHSMFLRVPFTRCHMLHKSAFTHVAPRLWNQLPFSIRSAQTLPAFKSMLKTHLFTECYS